MNDRSFIAGAGEAVKGFRRGAPRNELKPGGEGREWDPRRQNRTHQGQEEEAPVGPRTLHRFLSNAHPVEGQRAMQCTLQFREFVRPTGQ